MSSDQKFLEFSLDAQLYAIPLAAVKEVFRRPEVTKVANMPIDFEGIFNLRGSIIGLIDIKKSIGMKKMIEKASEVVVCVEHEGTTLGVSVDEVTRILTSKEEMLRKPPFKKGDPAEPYIQTIVQSGEDLIVVLDLHKLLNFESYQHEKAA